MMVKTRERKRVTPAAPRYDSVFFEGLEWLDSLDDDQEEYIFFTRKSDEDTE